MPELQASEASQEKSDGIGTAAAMEEDMVAEAEARLHIDPNEEKKLLAKLDLFLMPVIMLVYLCCFLDRSNIGISFSLLIYIYLMNLFD